MHPFLFRREITLVCVFSWKIEISKFEMGRIVDQDGSVKTLLTVAIIQD